MPRTVDITISADVADRLEPRLLALDGLIGLRRQRGASVQPPGDVLSVDVANRALMPLMHLLDEERIGHEAPRAWSSSEPLALVSPGHGEQVLRDISEATWEEMESRMAKESNATGSGMLMMAIAGAVAVAGIATNALHLAIGAMVIAPGFEPITRMALVVTGRGGGLRRGLVDFLKGYGALVAGALVAALVLRAFGQAPLGTTSSYLTDRALLAYWLAVTPSSLLVSALAAIAGAVLMAANRSVLTAGVMIALALVPTAALVGAGIATARLDLVVAALVRWGLDVLLVLALSAAVFSIKQRFVHRRRPAL